MASRLDSLKKPLPLFPRFEEISLEFRDAVRNDLARHPLEASEYTFTNLFAFRDAYNFKVASLRNNLIILKETEPLSFLCPVGNNELAGTLKELRGYLSGRPGEQFLERVPESFVSAHVPQGGGFQTGEDRDQFDYLHSVAELIELTGRKYHDKKNKVNKFRNRYRYQYEVLTPGMIDECLEFEHHWCEVRECHKYYGLHKERCAILEMLRNFSALDIRGGIIRVDGKISALTLGEAMLADTFVIHIEKAHSHIPGLYQV
ncbi:MAG: DUF2156 domain-containing protein, partial [Nitrospiraceae bacterium]